MPLEDSVQFFLIVELRLVEGATRNEGRLEIYLNKEWGTVCDDSWDLQDAKVACLQLGYSDAIAATNGGTFGSGAGPIHLDDVECVGHERSLSMSAELSSALTRYWMSGLQLLFHLRVSKWLNKTSIEIVFLTPKACRNVSETPAFTNCSDTL